MITELIYNVWQQQQQQQQKENYFFALFCFLFRNQKTKIILFIYFYCVSQKIYIYINKSKKLEITRKGLKNLKKNGNKIRNPRKNFFSLSLTNRVINHIFYLCYDNFCFSSELCDAYMNDFRDRVPPLLTNSLIKKKFVFFSS